MSSPNAGHNFGRVQVWPAGSQGSSKKLAVNASGTAEASAPAKGIGASGTIDIAYKPEAKDKSSKIVFIQVMRELLDGTPEKPSVLDKDFAYEDKDTTAKLRHVDYFDGEADPYYNGDDATKDSGTQGDATAKPAVDAKMQDAPHYAEADLPAGKSKVTYEFRTAAFSAAGTDAGTYYAYQDWTYELEKGKGEKTAAGASAAGQPGTDFTEAVDLWDSNHGFKLPTPPAAAPAAPPSPSPSPAPAPKP